MTAPTVATTCGPRLIARLAIDIADSAEWLSELDGAIGDGDHGVNMRRGMELAVGQLDSVTSLSDSLRLVGNTLLDDIGGAMGPLYGVFFLALSDAAEGHAEIDAQQFAQMLDDGTTAVVDLGGARLGDKTLVDVLIPASTAFDHAVQSGESFDNALVAMCRASAESRDATKILVARLGRSSRLAERSRGHIDAGAASCAVVLRSIATTFLECLVTESGRSSIAEGIDQ